ncbi:MAG: CDP-diacylglycerol--serine O-phosphatidyltransferase [Candidatus Electrothrix aestuarii]|uniref:CDP-diacylglycerol--serine O-phosphatidyltransferase n=1 Tax=Candidatus Electrothrix aestuarii TaxID=3062594 RepID=A0AAU8LXQ2_9BACT|nr:CDP-diacylglycerol--serine O-phosphatidyltransferase [Candidatus Electrothrix aestuarii]WPD23047.1 MAG: CDP-diacylglycerol--serine O-phosphatidyltransferase [Candidatus Electrothrix sp. GW3-3]
MRSNRFYALPSMLTCTSLFCGFYSIVASINGEFKPAAVAILVAGIFDGLDGRVARLTDSTSRFGMQLDSLCDLVSFGVAPALLAYLWALIPYGRYGWVAAFLYVATTALRLARFNSMAEDPENKNHDFVGLPCPAAAGAIATMVMFFHYLGATETVKHLSILLLVYLLSYLMISSHRYLSFKKTRIPREKRFQAVVGMILVLALLTAEHEIILFATALLYAASGLLLELYTFLQKKKKVPESED